MKPCPDTESNIFHSISEIWIQGGWIGVDLFFVLSGFLVSGLLFREHQKFGFISAKHFLIRRGFKLYPAFWVLIFCTVIFSLSPKQPLDVLRVILELLFLQNYAPVLWDHTWSLAVEEHFYLILVFIFSSLSNKSKSLNPFKSIPNLFIKIAIGCLLLRFLSALFFTPFKVHINLAPTHLRADSLFFGVLISYFWHYHQDFLLNISREYRWFFIFVGSLLLMPAFIFPLESTPFIYTLGLTIFYIGSGSLLIGFLSFKIPKCKIANFIAYIGSHSYSIYLWHIPVSLWGVPFLQTYFGNHSSWFLYFAIYMIISILFGVFMTMVVESPMLHIRDRFFPSRSRPFIML